jgi:hypothetical protein
VKRFEIRSPDVVRDAILHDAQAHGHGHTPGQGKSIVCNEAIRAYLNKQHYPKAVLDMDDETYAQLPGDSFEDRICHFLGIDPAAGFPRTRKGGS